MNLHDPLPGAVVGVPEDYDPAKCSMEGSGKGFWGGCRCIGAQHRTHMHRKKESKCIKIASLNHQRAGRLAESSRIKQISRYVADTTAACRCLFTQICFYVDFFMSVWKIVCWSTSRKSSTYWFWPHRCMTILKISKSVPSTSLSRDFFRSFRM